MVEGWQLRHSAPSLTPGQFFMGNRASLPATRPRPTPQAYRRPSPDDQTTQAARAPNPTRLRGPDTDEITRPPARPNARAAPPAATGIAAELALPIEVVGHISSYLHVDEMAAMALLVGRQGVADVASRPGPQAELLAIKQKVEAVIERASNANDEQSFVDTLGDASRPNPDGAPTVTSLRSDVLFEPYTALMRKIMSFSAETRMSSAVALAANMQANWPGDFPAEYASFARVVSNNDAELSARHGENFICIRILHGLDTQEQYDPVRDILYFNHAKPAVLAGEAPCDVVERYGLTDALDLEALEVDAASLDGTAGRAALAGEHVAVAADRHGFTTVAGIKALQLRASDGLRSRGEPQECTNVQALAARHGINDPDVIFRLESGAVDGRAGRAALSRRASVAKVAAAHGIVTPAGIRDLEVFVMPTRVVPGLLRGQNIRKLAARVGIASPAGLLAMEHHAINNLSVIFGPVYYRGNTPDVTARLIADRIGIQSEEGLARLRSAIWMPWAQEMRGF